MSENPKISTLTQKFMNEAGQEFKQLHNSLEAMHKHSGLADLSVHSAERQIEHFVGGFLSNVATIKFLEADSGGASSRLTQIKESLDFYLDMRFNENTILKAVEDGKIGEHDNPIPTMRRMQRILKDNFDL